MRRCKHPDWTVVARVYVPAAPPARASGVQPSTLLRLVYGFTNITQRCTKCGKVQVTSCVGRADVESKERS